MATKREFAEGGKRGWEIEPRGAGRRKAGHDSQARRRALFLLRRFGGRGKIKKTLRLGEAAAGEKSG